MPKLLIIWHSRTGTGEELAKQAEAGAALHIPVSRLHAEEAEPEALMNADGYLFVAPENLAALSGEMKAFFDRCYYPLLEQLQGRPYAQIIAAGSDGQGAARQLARIVTGWRLREVQPVLIIRTGAQQKNEILARKLLENSDKQAASATGEALALGLQMGVF